MKYGFLRLCAATPSIKVANCEYNAREILKLMQQSDKQGAEIVVFPELSVTGATCGDLFFQNKLISSAVSNLCNIIDNSKGLKPLYLVGSPISFRGRLYNCAVLFQDGKILGIVPKTENGTGRRHFGNIPNNTVFKIKIGKTEVPFGTNLRFYCDAEFLFSVGVSWGEESIKGDLPTVLLNPAAEHEIAGKAQRREEKISALCEMGICGLVYSNAGTGESGTDFVYPGHRFICDCDEITAKSQLFTDGITAGEIDIEKILSLRQRMGGIFSENAESIYFNLPWNDADIERQIRQDPFLPAEKGKQKDYCREILEIQARGLVRRMSHIGSSKAIVGISGGLDSTMALMVITRAFDIMELSRDGIIAVTMPCFGTTGRTMKNAIKMAKILGTTLLEIPIADAVSLHFEDIEHNPEKHDLTFENSQARERTQVLMDLGNKENALVIGTGDLSELALGWATYNGDHMSMFGVNSSVPKSVMRKILGFMAEETEEELSKVILDVLETPVSPELLPAKDGKIAQITEDIVGPYELHDFFIYNMLSFGFSPKKIFYLACKAFSGQYKEELILKYLKLFYRRFFTQQFKRSCSPDGVGALPISLSPRGGLKMPSDTDSRLWIDEIEEIKL